MTVADANCYNSPKQIQVSLPTGIPQPLHMPLNDHDWVLVVGQKPRSQVSLSNLHGLIIGNALQKHTILHINTYNSNM